jgi:hypothetical protein
VAGNCPLLFEISESGSGLGTVIIDGIERVLSSNPFDVSAKLVDDPADGVDVVSAFVDCVEADDSAPHPCTQGLTTIDTNGNAADNGDIAYGGQSENSSPHLRALCIGNLSDHQGHGR